MHKLNLTSTPRERRKSLGSTAGLVSIKRRPNSANPTSLRERRLSNSARVPASAMTSSPSTASLPRGQPPAKLRRRKSLDELRQKNLEEEERLKFYQKDEDDGDGVTGDDATNLDPMYYEAPPYPKELLKDEIEEEEKRRKAIDDNDKRRRRNSKLSVGDTNKKIVSQVIARGMVDGRKIWTEEELVERDMDETISSFKEKRDREKRSEKRLGRKGSREEGKDSLDARLGGRFVVVEDEEFDPRREVEKDYDNGVETGVGGDGGKVFREFRHSWSKTSLIELARDAEKDKIEEEKRKQKHYKGPMLLLNNDDPLKPILMDEETDGDEAIKRRKKARRKFSTKDKVLDEMVIQPVIKKKEGDGKEKKERRSFRKSLDRLARRSLDAFGRFAGVVEQDLRKIHIDDPESHPVNQPNYGMRPPSSRYKARRRPSLDLQPNLRHLLPKEERERLDRERPATAQQLRAMQPRGERKSRLSFDNVKMMVKTAGSFIKEVTESKKTKAEKYDKFLASIKIKLFIMRVRRRVRRETSAKVIQRCWREFRHAIIVEKWMIAAGFERREQEMRERREEKRRLKEENAKKVEKRALKKAAIEAAQKAPGGYVKPPKGKKAREKMIIEGWKKKDDALMLAIQYKYGLPSSWNDPKMEHFIERWDTKPPKLIFKRIDLLYQADVFEEMTDEYLDLLTEEERDKYIPGFGTSNMLAKKDNWGRTETDFDYRNRKQGGKFIRSVEKVANQEDKYKYDSDGEMLSDEEDVTKRKNPIARVKIG